MPNLDDVYNCMFCGHTGHLHKFCFRHKGMEKRHVDYARNSYRDKFFDFLSRSYSRALPHTSSSALSHFSHRPNHHSYIFGSRENNLVPRRFGNDPHPHYGDRFPRRPGFHDGGSYTHLEPRHLYDPHFLRRGSRPTQPNGEVQRTMKTFLGHMVKC
jgi:hypothetical protein